MQICALALAMAGGFDAVPPRHYVFFGRDRDALRADSAFLRSAGFDGAQLSYFWRQLEPRKDVYDFAAIEQDLAFLRSHGKKLWIQLQDVSFSNSNIPVPPYLLADSAYHGGAAQEYESEKDDDSDARPSGWATRRWDPAVQERFYRLLAALGQQFDGRIEGINFAETSIGFGQSGRYFPAGFTPTTYRDAVIANIAALKKAFPKSVALVYANFMPGEWRPSADRGYLSAVYAAAGKAGVGVGGPDLLPHRRGQLLSSYPLIHDASASVPVGMAVQDGNLNEMNPATGKRVTAAELLEFATGYLGADYIFWGTEEPFYSNDVMQLVGRSARPSAAPRSRRVLMMDSPHPARVYDAETLAQHGTNADALSDILRDLPLHLQTEAIGPDWHRDAEARQFRPDLVLVHWSGFCQEECDPERARLRQFIEYMRDTDAQFLIYSRQPADSLPVRVGRMLDRVPGVDAALRARVHTFALDSVRGIPPHWRNAVTANALKLHVRRILDLD